MKAGSYSGFPSTVISRITWSKFLDLLDRKPVPGGPSMTFAASSIILMCFTVFLFFLVSNYLVSVAMAIKFLLFF